MSTKQKLLVDTSLFIVPGGTKRDVRRLKERAQRAQDEGSVEIVDISSLNGKYDVALARAVRTAAPRR